MKQFNGKITTVGNSRYILIPHDKANEYNVLDGEFYEVILRKLVPEEGKHVAI